MQTRLELADYEAENLARLQKMFSRYSIVQCSAVDMCAVQCSAVQYCSAVQCTAESERCRAAADDCLQSPEFTALQEREEEEEREEEDNRIMRRRRITVELGGG